ncbi:hypothetical protein [Flavobacterium granuli]|uniref:Uncharacterized protein n=1 Tax=Flavobacterium granuli TaxID=280093 RepID=A0ABU1S0V8_9FLAO|nr:hypothetical protein [Flavobacterium granuli]MDR6844672.1 hypothetical protein [Flavobacterium granuli]
MRKIIFGLLLIHMLGLIQSKKNIKNGDDLHQKLEKLKNQIDIDLFKCGNYPESDSISVLVIENPTTKEVNSR